MNTRCVRLGDADASNASKDALTVFPQLSLSHPPDGRACTKDHPESGHKECTAEVYQQVLHVSPTWIHPVSQCIFGLFAFSINCFMPGPSRCWRSASDISTNTNSPTGPVCGPSNLWCTKARLRRLGARPVDSWSGDQRQPMKSRV